VSSYNYDQQLITAGNQKWNQ